mmetsp:Transcript_4809/g.7214  ORF Transcript_4809/g.7214 Transcript_4809/m.7214 type:complete len:245 (-) Transcript_4809:13-747(-)
MKPITLYSITCSLLILCNSIAFARFPLNSVEVKYLNAKGAAENTRIILALANCIFYDNRLEGEVYYDRKGRLVDIKIPGYEIAKEDGQLTMSLGRLPILILNDDHVIGNSRSIERFLAKHFGMMGSNPIQEAKIDCIAEHCRGLKEKEGQFSRKQWEEQELPVFFQNLEAAVRMTSEAPGYAVGSSTSLADVYIFSLFYSCESFDADAIAEAAKDCKMLLSIATRVFWDGDVSEYILERPSREW